MKGRADRHSRNHGRVLDAAEALFFRYGYQRVTIEEIAKSMSISKKTLYELFPSKKSIASEAMQRAARLVVDTQSQMSFLNPATFREELIAFLRVIAEANARFSVPFYDDLRVVEPLLYRRSVQWRLRYVKDTLSNILRSGKTLGLVHADLNPTLTSEVLTRIMTHFVHPDQRVQSDYSPKQETVICVLLHGIIQPHAQQNGS